MSFNCSSGLQIEMTQKLYSMIYIETLESYYRIDLSVSKRFGYRKTSIPLNPCDMSHPFFSFKAISFDLQTHMLLMDAFLQNNRLDHVSRVMSSHPTYLDHFLRTQHFILRGDGPLPYDYRHLIAIMVSTCSRFFPRQKLSFPY